MLHVEAGTAQLGQGSSSGEPKWDGEELRPIGSLKFQVRSSPERGRRCAQRRVVGVRRSLTLPLLRPLSLNSYPPHGLQDWGLPIKYSSKGPHFLMREARAHLCARRSLCMWFHPVLVAVTVNTWGPTSPTHRAQQR